MWRIWTGATLRVGAIVTHCSDPAKPPLQEEWTFVHRMQGNVARERSLRTRPRARAAPPERLADGRRTPSLLRLRAHPARGRARPCVRARQGRLRALPDPAGRRAAAHRARSRRGPWRHGPRPAQSRLTAKSGSHAPGSLPAVDAVEVSNVVGRPREQV